MKAPDISCPGFHVPGWKKYRFDADTEGGCSRKPNHNPVFQPFLFLVKNLQKRLKFKGFR